MFNKDFIESVKQALDPRANLFTFINGQKEANEDYIKSIADNELYTTSAPIFIN